MALPVFSRLVWVLQGTLASSGESCRGSGHHVGDTLPAGPALAGLVMEILTHPISDALTSKGNLRAQEDPSPTTQKQKHRLLGWSLTANLQ